MWADRAWAGVLLAGLIAATAWSAGDGSTRRHEVYPARFADGDGRPLAERYCQICHAASLVTQQAKDSTGWEKTLAQMEQWGIRPTPAEHETLRAYLRSHYGPRAR